MMRAVLLLIFGAFVGAGVVIGLWFRADIAEAHLRLAGRTQSIETPFGRLEYAESGRGVPALIIHGTGGGFDQGLGMARALAGYGYRLIAPSRFGYLGSTPSRPTLLEMQADALVPLLDHLNVDRAVVFGGSAGALAAMEFAIRHPQRCQALVLLVPAAYAPTRKPNTSGAEGPLLEGMVRTLLNSDFLFWGMQRMLPGTMAQMLLATNPAVIAAASAPEQERFNAVMRNILPVSRRGNGILFDMATAGDPPQMDLKAIRCPVLTLSTRDDMFGTAAPAEFIAAGVPDGRAIIYETGGHLWVGHEEEVWRAISAFLAPIVATRPLATSPRLAP